MLGTVYESHEHVCAARVSVRMSIVRRVGPWFMNEKRVGRRGVPGPRTLFRVLIFGGMALAVLTLPAASGATTLRSAGARTGQTTTLSRLQAGTGAL